MLIIEVGIYKESKDRRKLNLKRAFFFFYFQEELSLVDHHSLAHYLSGYIYL